MKFEIQPVQQSETPATATPNTATDLERKEAAKAITSSIFKRETVRSPSVTDPQETPPAAPPATPPAATPPPATPPATPAANAPRITMSDEVATYVRTARDGTMPAPAPAAPAFKMIDEDEEDYQVLLFLAKKDPAKYGAMPAQFVEFVKKNYEFQDKWMAENPGKEFDYETDEYKQWLESNQPPLDKDAIDRHRIDMIVERRVSERYEAEVKPDLDRINGEKAWRENYNVVATNVDSRIFKFVEAVSPELAKFLRNGDKIDLTEENGKKVDAADPIAHKVMTRISEQELMPLLVECEKMAIPAMKFRLNMANPLHARIRQCWDDAEKDLLRASVEEQTRNGATFMTTAQRRQAETAIRNGSGTQAQKEAKLAELEAGTWTLSIDDIEDLFVQELSAKAKAQIAEIEEPAKRKYGRPASPQPEVPPREPAPDTQRPPAAEQPPAPQPQSNGRPPSMPSGSDSVPVERPAEGGPQSLGQQVSRVMWAK